MLDLSANGLPCSLINQVNGTDIDRYTLCFDGGEYQVVDVKAFPSGESTRSLQIRAVYQIRRSSRDRLRRVQDAKSRRIKDELMSSIGLNLCTFAGNLAADVQPKEVTLQQGEKRQVLEATLYVPYRRSGGGAGNRKSFTVRLSIWPDSPAWRTQTYLKKGSLVICSGALEPRPYISASDQQPKAGLQMIVFNIVLDRVRGMEEEESAEAESLEPGEYEEKGALAAAGQSELQ